MKYIFSLIIVGLLCLNACKNKSAEAGKSQVFIDAANFDTLTKPGDDFFQYANGAWLKNTEIPADKSRWGSFNILREEAQEKIKTIIDEVSKQKDAKKGTPAQQIADLYNAAMDTVALDKAGFDPIKPTLDKIKNLKDVNELVKAVASAYESGMTGSPFSMYVYADDKNSNQVMVNMVQGGTALPSKDYYVKTDEKTKAIREKYNQYIANIFKLIGVDAAAAAKNAKTVLMMETRLANASKFPDEMRDPIANYNKLPKAAVDKLLSNINGVSSYLENAQLKNVDSINVPNPKYYQEVNNMFKSVSLDDWKTYLTYQTVNEAATYLSKPFRDEKFDFFSKTMTGVKEQKPRWKQAVDLVENSLGEPLGKLYAEKYFPTEAKKRMMELIDNLDKSYQNHIKTLDWMSDSTKQKALAKLSTITRKIGFPDKWKDYSSIDIDKNNLFKSAVNAGRYQYLEMVNKYGKPVDKTEWEMTPQTVNAYYNPSYNEIVFPAGILQFPFFDFKADDAVNYGAIGFVIGHELSHGFDDQGSLYDKDGNLNDWWSKEDRKNFTDRTKKIVDLFNSFDVNGQKVNGSLTLGENIADFGGLATAYDAFKMTKQGQSNEKIDGFTPDQRFLLSATQVWRMKARPEFETQMLLTDPHSPAKWRINGPIPHLDVYYTAFNVKEGDKMYVKPEDRIKVW